MPARLPRPVRIAVVLATALLGVLALPAATAEPAVDPADGADETPLPSTAVTLYVDDDAVLPPNGTPLAPYPTIGWGVAVAQQVRSWGYPVRVVVQPGTYRERVEIGSAGENPPLVLEAADPGTAVVSGAEVRTDWTAEPGTPLWSAPWAHDWGLAPVPGSWRGVSVPDGVRRREAVFVDGAPLGQVLRRADLAPGTFFVDGAADELLVNPPAGAEALDEHLVEVAERGEALRIKGQAHDITVRGLVFEKAATPFTDHMAYLTDSTDVLVEGNTFRHASWGGLGLASVDGVTIRGNHAVDNGGNGIDSYRTHDAVLEGNVIEASNQRGARFGFLGWSVAGSKHLLLHRAVLRGNTYHRNAARGLWLDTDVADVLVDRDRATGNQRDGAFVEAVQGPLRIQDSTFAGNGGAGVLVGTSGGVTIDGSTLADNRYGQLVFAGDRSRSWTDHETGASITMPDFRDWILTDNQLSSAASWPLVHSPNIPISDWRRHLEAGAIVARGNTWARPSLDDAIQIRNVDFPLAEWNSLTGDSAP